MAKFATWILFAVILVWCEITHAQDPVPASGCRTPAPMAGFNIEKIFGTWYKLHIGNFGYQGGLGCAADIFTLYGRTDITYQSLYYYNNGQFINQTSQFLVNQFYTGYVSVPNHYDLRVIDTDYMNYMVWLICDTSSGTPVERVASATRLYFGTITQTTTLRIREAFRKIGYDPDTLQVVDRSLCGYVPVFYPN